MTAFINIKSLALLVWAVINALLALAIGREFGWGENLHLALPAPVVHPSAPVEVTLPPDYRLPAREKTYAVTLERPLFVPSRREAPPVPPPPPPPPPTMKKGQFQLLGTTITDEVRVAIVKEVASGKVRQIMVTHTINGLRLEQVEPDRIVFVQYDDREELRLKIQPSPKVQPPGQPGGVSAASTNIVPPARAIRRGARTPAPNGGEANQ
jgi:hypothetical protein